MPKPNKTSSQQLTVTKRNEGVTHSHQKRGGLVGTSNPPSNTWQIAIQGNYAYAADYSNGLCIVDITNLASPTVVGTFNPGITRSTSVAVSSNIAYFVNGNNGIYVLNVSNPASPTQKGSDVSGGRFVLDSALQGNYLYMAGEVGSGLKIENISNPAAPTSVGSYSISGSSQGIAVSGDMPLKKQTRNLINLKESNGVFNESTLRQTVPHRSSPLSLKWQ